MREPQEAASLGVPGCLFWWSQSPACLGAPSPETPQLGSLLPAPPCHASDECRSCSTTCSRLLAETPAWGLHPAPVLTWELPRLLLPLLLPGHGPTQAGSTCSDVTTCLCHSNCALRAVVLVSRLQSQARGCPETGSLGKDSGFSESVFIRVFGGVGAENA